MGNLYKSRAGALQSILEIRNKFLFAHGFEPISGAEFAEVEQVMGGFIRARIQLCVEPKLQQLLPEQFPMSLDK